MEGRFAGMARVSYVWRILVNILYVRLGLGVVGRDVIDLTSKCLTKI